MIYTVAWLLVLAQIIVLEFVAYHRGGYWATATGHLIALMLLHPVLFIVVPMIFVGVGAHLLADGVVLTRPVK